MCIQLEDISNYSFNIKHYCLSFYYSLITHIYTYYMYIYILIIFSVIIYVSMYDYDRHTTKLNLVGSC